MTGQERPDARPANVAAGPLVGRVGAELARLSALTAEVQEAISQIGPGQVPPGGAVRKLQHIDLVTQSLGDLGRLLAALAAELPEGTDVPSFPLLATLRLRDLDSIVATPAPDTPRPAGRCEDTFWL